MPRLAFRKSLRGPSRISKVALPQLALVAGRAAACSAPCHIHIVPANRLHWQCVLPAQCACPHDVGVTRVGPCSCSAVNQQKLLTRRRSPLHCVRSTFEGSTCPQQQSISTSLWCHEQTSTAVRRHCEPAADCMMPLLQSSFLSQSAPLPERCRCAIRPGPLGRSAPGAASIAASSGRNQLQATRWACPGPDLIWLFAAGLSQGQAVHCIAVEAAEGLDSASHMGTWLRCTLPCVCPEQGAHQPAPLSQEALPWLHQ